MLKHIPLLALVILWQRSVWSDGYRFDMGGETTPLAPGYTRVTHKTMLTGNTAYGWLRPPAMVVIRSDPANPYYAQGETGLEYCLYSDAVLSIEENTFEFRAQPGRYAVTVAIGDLALDEVRPGNSIWANGVLVASNETTNATVKVFTFPVDATGGKISLRFRADSEQKYVTVEAVSADPLPEGQNLKPSMQELPEQPPTREDYRRNWQHFVDLYVADWEKAKTELRAEGVDFHFWEKVNASVRQESRYREYYAWGMGAWERLESRMGELSLERLCPVFREMGLDGFLANGAIAARELPRGGLKYAVAGHAESSPRRDTRGITLNLIRKADGSLTTIPNVWSNCAPEVIDAFKELWRTTLGAAAGRAQFFIIDEPRGMWYSGGYGDHSEPAQQSFKQWAAEHGWTHLADKGIPDRGRTWDFYRFYQFRLESVARFVKAFIKNTPVENVPTAPGNGNIGPEQMNHNTYWPPAMARHRLIASSWAYDSPASCKMYAETVRMAEEFGGQSIIVPPMYPELHTPMQDLPMATACISALNTKVIPWHFGGPLTGPHRDQWMKIVYYSARLTHATTGLVHLPSLYVWCPESIVYNDLVEMNRAEADHWRKVWQTLFDANIDYAVTNAFAVPRDAVVLYACVRPALNREEFARLRKFTESGGTVLYSFGDAPEFPDGSKIAEWDKIRKDRLEPVDLTPEGLRAKLDGRVRERNWNTGNPAVKSYLYRRNKGRVHLLNNTHLANPAALRFSRALTDVFTGKVITAGSPVSLAPGHYALLAE